MACMLWENTFYESGVSISERISDLVGKVTPEEAHSLAVEARSKMKLRHVPLWIAVSMAKLPSHRTILDKTIPAIIQRADELTEFLSLYWKDGKCPLAARVKKGLAEAFTRFDAYQLAKYNRDGAIKLRDVLFLCHAKPKDKEQEGVWSKLIDGTLESPDTWEVALSSGSDKAEVWARLVSENKLGGMAVLRNIRNMKEVLDKPVVRKAIAGINASRILPFRFITAAKHNPEFEDSLESRFFESFSEKGKLLGETLILVDVSGSMRNKVSGRSEISRLDAANGLAMILREQCESLEVFTFSSKLAEVPARRGFALADAINNSQPHSSTLLGATLKCLLSEKGSTHTLKRGMYGEYIQVTGLGKKPDRIIVITDEQSSGPVIDPPKGVMGYMINVACYKNGVGYGPWTHIDGWSDSVVDYILELESDQ